MKLFATACRRSVSPRNSFCIVATPAASILPTTFPDTHCCDSAGNVPERYVKQLCSNRVNYYFAQINSSTILMTEIFAKEYQHSQNAVFKILDRTADATTFIPLVVESIRDSMRRSACFGSGKGIGSSSKAAHVKSDPRTVFHSIL